MVFDLEVRAGSDLLNKYRIICLAYMHAEKLTIILPSSKLIIKLKLYFLLINISTRNLETLSFISKYTV
jgi:hypothetical protein